MSDRFTWEDGDVEVKRAETPKTDMAESLFFNNRDAATDHGGKSAVEAVSKRVIRGKLDTESWNDYYKRCASRKDANEQARDEKGQFAANGASSAARAATAHAASTGTREAHVAAAAAHSAAQAAHAALGVKANDRIAKQHMSVAKKEAAVERRMASNHTADAGFLSGDRGAAAVAASRQARLSSKGVAKQEERFPPTGPMARTHAIQLVSLHTYAQQAHTAAAAAHYHKTGTAESKAHAEKAEYHETQAAELAKAHGIRKDPTTGMNF